MKKPPSKSIERRLAIQKPARKVRRKITPWCDRAHLPPYQEEHRRRPGTDKCFCGNMTYDSKKRPAPKATLEPPKGFGADPINKMLRERDSVTPKAVPVELSREEIMEMRGPWGMLARFGLAMEDAGITPEKFAEGLKRLKAPAKR